MGPLMILVDVLLQNGSTRIWEVEFRGVPVLHPDGNRRVPLGEQPEIRKPADLPLTDQELHGIAAALVDGTDHGVIGACSWRVKLYRHP